MLPMTIEARILDDFRGSWSLERIITHEGGGQARFSGHATWTTDGDGLAYFEQGQLAMDDQPPVVAQQRYLWQSDLTVLFSDGRFFHRVPPQGGETRHWCDPDTYVGHYDFDQWPDFQVQWQVQGPKKSYRMISNYQRC